MPMGTLVDGSGPSPSGRGPKVRYEGDEYYSNLNPIYLTGATIYDDYVFGYNVPTFVLDQSRLMLMGDKTVRVTNEGVIDGTDEALLITGPLHAIRNENKIFGDIGIATRITSNVSMSGISIDNIGTIQSDTHAIKLQASGLTRLPSASITNRDDAVLTSTEGAAIDARTDASRSPMRARSDRRSPTASGRAAAMSGSPTRARSAAQVLKRLMQPARILST